MAVSNLSFQPPLPANLQAASDRIAGRVNALEKRANEVPKKIEQQIAVVEKKIKTLEKFLLGPLGKKLNPAKSRVTTARSKQLDLSTSLTAQARSTATAYAGLQNNAAFESRLQAIDEQIFRAEAKAATDARAVTAQLNGADLSLEQVQIDPEVASQLPIPPSPPQNFFFSCNGQMLLTGKLTVVNIGVWFLDAVFAEDAELIPGKVTVKLDDLTLIGTIRQGGIFADQRRVRIIGGNGSWSDPINSKHYHNDAGVRASAVANEIAATVGETLSFSSSTSLGTAWTREAGNAAKALEAVLAGKPWYVAYDGVTHVGERVTSPAKDIEIVEFDQRTKRGVLSFKKASDVKIGTVLTQHVEPALVIREIEFVVSDDSFRANVVCGEDLKDRSLLAHLLEKIAQRSTDKRLLGTYHYKVIGMAGDKARLQAVDHNDDLPDAAPLAMWAGAAGIHAELKAGCEVSVIFLNGNRAKPRINGFIGKGGTNWVPQTLHIGGTNGPEAARKGDAVAVTMPPMTFTGTFIAPNGAPTPISGTVAPTMPTLPGTIIAGWPGVKIGGSP